MENKSEALKKIKEFRGGILINLYNQCTSEQQLLFRRMYSHKNLEASIEEISDKIPNEKFDWAIQQCERTIINNNKKLQTNEPTCSCGGGENNGHNWNCPLQEEQIANVDYKAEIRKMMEESGSELLIYLPQLSATERAQAQVIVMNSFFKIFLPTTNLETLQKDYRQIKPSV